MSIKPSFTYEFKVHQQSIDTNQYITKTVDLNAEFERAVAVVRDPKSASLFNDGTKLKFYSLFKQATTGDLPEDVATPSVFQVVARAKHKAWEDLRGITKDDAKLRYIQTLQGADPSFILVLDPTVESSAKKEERPEDPQVNQPLQPVAISTDNGLVEARPYPPMPINVSSNSLFKPAIAGCGMLIAVGMAGFTFTVLSWTALFFLSVAIAGLAGVIGSIMLVWDENGLLPLLPEYYKTLLFDSTILELLVEDKFFAEVKEMMIQVLPAFLAKDEVKMLEALSHMSPRLRQKLTTRGLVRFLSPMSRRILLPRALRRKILESPPSFRLPNAIKVDEVKLQQVVTQGKESDPPKLDLSRELFRSLFSEVVSKNNVELVLSTLNPKRLRFVITMFSAATLAQLAISSESRRFFISFVRAAILLLSMGSASVSAGLLLLWITAKRWQKRLDG
jgi:diazepam-binding inhibitor (GABA receptor modulating acyl-CoA-binding protein)